MTHLIQIGNSKGIRIPKPIIKQAKLDNIDLQLKVVDNGLLITPSENPRENWKEQIDKILKTKGQEPTDTEWLESDLNSSDNDWEW